MQENINVKDVNYGAHLRCYEARKMIDVGLIKVRQDSGFKTEQSDPVPCHNTLVNLFVTRRSKSHSQASYQIG